MRTTLDIDADVLAVAKDLAQQGGKTTGQILSELAGGLWSLKLRSRFAMESLYSHRSRAPRRHVSRW
jgi:Leu/Phe-tRNA-protein transferase